jgi:hypothetical protein
MNATSMHFSFGVRGNGDLSFGYILPFLHYQGFFMVVRGG